VDREARLTPYRAVVIGWHGSRERQLRPIGRHHASLGADVITHIPGTLRAMVLPHGWEDDAAALARALIDRDRADPRPLVIHALSNAGFWSLTGLLLALERGSHDPLLDRVRAVILDSAPGFPERFSARFTAEFATRAMLPGVLASLALAQGDARARALRPLARAFFTVWHPLARTQVRFISSSHEVIARHLRDRPLLLVYGGADALVLASIVDRFASSAAAAGARVERLFFPESPHVRHLLGHRREYFAAVRRTVALALALPAV
jgi:hypothetical protein